MLDASGFVLADRTARPIERCDRTRYRSASADGLRRSISARHTRRQLVCSCRIVDNEDELDDNLDAEDDL